MKTVRFQPTLAALSGSIDPFEIKNSIVLIEDGTEYLIGDDAYKLGDSGARIVGGTVKDRHYQRLIKALLAKGLGAGEHEISVGFSASSNYMDEFRDSSSKNILSEEDFNILSDKVSEIKFRVARTDAPVQVCRVNLTKKKVPVLYETEAVRNVIPESAKTYVSKLTADIESSIHLKLKNPSPPRFKKYGSHYVTYKPNKNTTWYVFFSMRADRYLVRFITNNHVSAQHIRGL